LLLVLFVGLQMRSVILAVPPVLPAIRSDLHLSYFLTGALTAIPVFCLGAAAIPGAVLVARFGARAIVGVAMLGLGVGALLRLLPPELLFVFAGTVLLAVSVSIAQPAIPVLVRRWFGDHVQQVSTGYGISLSIGALTAASATIYLLVFGGWRGTFLLWSLPPLLAAAVWWTLSPREHERRRQANEVGAALRGRLGWFLAALFGCQSMAYFGAQTWIPFLLGHEGSGHVALTLLMLNLAGLPLQLALTFTRRPWARSRPFYIVSGCLILASSLGFLLELGLGQLAWLWAALFGLGGSMNFSGAFALPPLLARTGAEAASLTSVMLTAGYALALFGPLIGGVLLDTTGVLSAPFAIFCGGGLLLVLLALFLPLRPLAQLDSPDLA
jgi:CP family cyanate transporter-like MFS transporter